MLLSLLNWSYFPSTRSPTCLSTLSTVILETHQVVAPDWCHMVKKISVFCPCIFMVWHQMSWAADAGIIIYLRNVCVSMLLICLVIVSLVYTFRCVPLTRRMIFADRSFNIVGPKLWNCLPKTIRDSPNLDCFKKHLKTHMFDIAFKLFISFLVFTLYTTILVVLTTMFCLILICLYAYYCCTALLKYYCIKWDYIKVINL